METLKFYISQLKPKRAKIFSKSWWTVGCTIYNCTEGSEEGREMWHKFSTQDIDEYTNSRCDKKWLTFKKYVKQYTIRSLVSMIYEDGGTTYNPSESQIVEDEDVRKFVFGILVPKLSIRRMRNRVALGNLCSAMYTMSEGKDREAMLKVSKRIKDTNLRIYFVSLWNHPRVFRFVCDINSIISWYNNDEKENPNPRATNIGGYFKDPLWLSRTTTYLKFYDDRGFTPRYFKVTVKERKELKSVVSNRKFLNKLHAIGDHETAELHFQKNILEN